MTGVELRAADDGKFVLRGHASVTETPYPVGGRFVETVAKGSFRRTLAEDPHVVLLINHGKDGGLPLASTRSTSGPPTLRLSEDDRGLFTEADLHPGDPRVQSLRATAQQMPLEMSFGFTCTSDSWSEDMTERRITGVSLHKGDVTVTPFGANPATSMTIDSRVASFTLEQRRAFVGELSGAREWRTAPILDAEMRAGYAAHELAELGAKGEAFLNPDGHWSFPTRSRLDWENAKLAVGRGGGSHNQIRKYLIGRARVLGLSHLVPSNWAPSGALRSLGLLDLPDRVTGAAQELDLMRLKAR